jgi:hypothetical protein
VIVIDPNVRVTDNHTFTFVDNPGDYRAGDAHVVIEEESGMTWPATIMVLRDDGYMELDVAWEKWKR